MKKFTYKKTEVHIKHLLQYNGTIESAKQIFETLKHINENSVRGFKLKYDFQYNNFIFDWNGYTIDKDNFISIENSLHEYIEIYTIEELQRLGFELQK